MCLKYVKLAWISLTPMDLLRLVLFLQIDRWPLHPLRTNLDLLRKQTCHDSRRGRERLVICLARPWT
jgi:hypothetical protein